LVSGEDVGCVKFIVNKARLFIGVLLHELNTGLSVDEELAVLNVLKICSREILNHLCDGDWVGEKLLLGLLVVLRLNREERDCHARGADVASAA
jgi:hypothetical protein